MSKRKRIAPNVVRGGVAIPLGSNYFLMKGNKHEQGGIDIGKDLEVEGGEIIKINNNGMKILSDAPIMNGISPAQMALGGLQDGTFAKRFDEGFKYQEKFKDINGLKDDGTKAKLGKKKALMGNESEDKKLVEDVVRTTRGITGNFLDKRFPFVNTDALKYAIQSWKVMKGNKNKVAPSNDNYTGALIKDGSLSTDDGLGFATQDDLKRVLGEDPVDFVDSYVTGETPFRKQGVFKKNNAKEKRIYTSKLKRMNAPDINVFQTHRDTLDTKTLKLIEDRLVKGKYTYNNSNTTYQGSPFEIGNSGIIYDGNNSTTMRVVLPDGRVFYKTNDIFDTDPKEWNYKVGPFAKKGLKFIHDNTIPFMMTTPWYNGKVYEDEEERMKNIFGIYTDNGKLYNEGDANGKVWDVNEAVKWLEQHPYEIDLEGAKSKEYNKLGGKVNMKRNKRSVPSTGEKRKANVGDWIPITNINSSSLIAKNPLVRADGTIITKKDTLQIPQVISNGNGMPAPSFLDANPNFISNAINVGGNLIGSTISYFANRKMLKDLEEPKAPYALHATKFKTNININPQLRAIKNTLNQYRRLIDKNTASSQVGISRFRDVYDNYLKNTLDVQSTKENQETQLINQDLRNQQEVARYNLENYNNWIDKTTAFKNKIRESQSENTQDYVQNLTGTLGNYLNNDAQWKQSMANIAALSAAYPDVTPELMYSKGISYPLWLQQRNARRAAKKNNIG